MGRRHTQFAKSRTLQYVEIDPNLVPITATVERVDAIPSTVNIEKPYLSVLVDGLEKVYRIMPKVPQTYTDMNQSGVMMGEPAINVTDGYEAMFAYSYDTDTSNNNPTDISVYRPATNYIEPLTDDQHVTTGLAVSKFVLPNYVSNSSATPSITVAENTIYSCTKQTGITSLSLNVSAFASEYYRRESKVYLKTNNSTAVTVSITGASTGMKIYGGTTLDSNTEYVISIDKSSIKVNVVSSKPLENGTFTVKSANNGSEVTVASTSANAKENSVLKIKGDSMNPVDVSGFSNYNLIKISHSAIETTTSVSTSSLKKITTDGFGHIVTTTDATVSDLSGAAPLASPALTGTPTAPTAANGTNTTQIATTEFVNNSFAANDAMVFKGTIGTGGTPGTLPSNHKKGWTYKVIENGTYAGQTCEIGDMIICVTNGATENNAHWVVVQSNIDGAVIGPSSSTANNIVTFDGSTGKLIKDSGKTIGEGTFSIKSKIGNTETTISSTNANTSTNNSFTLIQGNNVSFTNNTTTKTLTISANRPQNTFNDGILSDESYNTCRYFTYDGNYNSYCKKVIFAEYSHGDKIDFSNMPVFLIVDFGKYKNECVLSQGQNYALTIERHSTMSGSDEDILITRNKNLINDEEATHFLFGICLFEIIPFIIDGTKANVAEIISTGEGVYDDGIVSDSANRECRFFMFNSDYEDNYIKFIEGYGNTWKINDIIGHSGYSQMPIFIIVDFTGTHNAYVLGDNETYILKVSHHSTLSDEDLEALITIKGQPISDAEADYFFRCVRMFELLYDASNDKWFAEIICPDMVNEGNFQVYGKHGNNNSVNVSTFNANSDTNASVTFIDGDNITLTPNSTKNSITIEHTDVETTNAVTTSSLKKIKTDGKGHITETANVTSSDISSLVGDGKFDVKTKVSTTTTTIASTSANASSSSFVTFEQGSNINITGDITNQRITISAPCTSFNHSYQDLNSTSTISVTFGATFRGYKLVSVNGTQDLITLNLTVNNSGENYVTFINNTSNDVPIKIRFGTVQYDGVTVASPRIIGPASKSADVGQSLTFKIIKAGDSSSNYTLVVHSEIGYL